MLFNNNMPLRCKTKENPELVLLINGSGELTQTDILKFNDFFTHHLHNDKRFKSFIDLRGVSSVSLTVVKEMAKYMRSYELLAPKKVERTAVLVGSRIETMLNILFQIKPPVTPTRVTASVEEACEFLNS